MSSHHGSQELQLKNALDRVGPTLEAIPTSELAPIRHDIAAAVATVLAVARTASRHRDEIQTELGDEAAASLDRLDEAGAACGEAHSKYVAFHHARGTDELVAETSQQRQVLLAEARTQVGQSRMPASALAGLIGGTGQKALYMDVLVLVAAFRGHWEDVSSRTMVTTDELDHAEAIAHALATAIGESELAGASTSPPAILRQRAYTYMLRTYEEVRRAITFVRWDDGDADAIAPSLSAGRTRKSADDDGDVTPTVPVTPATPVTPVSGNGATTDHALPGMPNASPFVTPS